ncbi:MAG: site-specific integrase [Nanoarchaeota archaeon]|nr:site-specific integrase [Nanoarchaeota archaeon]
MRKKEKEEIPANVKADLKAFDKWLKENTTLNDLSRDKYVLQIKKLHKVSNSDININSIRKFLVESGRNYMRKYALKSYIKFLGCSVTWNEELKTDYKKIKMQSRQYEREISSFKAFRTFMNCVSPELHLILRCLWDTTCRIGGVLSIDTPNIKTDDAGTYLWLREKGDKHIKRYLHDSTALLLKEYIDTHNIADGRVFINKGESQSKAYYRYWTELKNKSRKAKLMSPDFGISFHWIRTTRIIQFYEQTKNIGLCQRLANHASSSTTLIYTAPAEIEHDKILKKEGEIW